MSGITVTDQTANVTGGPITLAPGVSDSTTFTATRTLTQADIDAGGVTNTATANGTAPNGDDVSDDSDSGSDTPEGNDATGDDDPTFTTLPAQPELEVFKTALPRITTVLAPGDALAYEITVTNVGNVTVSGVTVTDPLFTPSDVTSKCVFPNTTANDLAPTETAVCEVEYILTQADIDAGLVENTATADGTDPSGDPVSDDSDSTNPADDTGSDDDPTVVSIDPTPELELIKNSDGITDANGNGLVDLGDVVNYTFTVSNTGNVTISGITIDDPTATVVGGPITLTPSASDSTTFTATYTLTQADIDAGGVTNTATAGGTDPSGNPVEDISDSGGDTPDGNDGTGDDDPTFTVLASEPALEVFKTAVPSFSTPPTPGDTITYTVEVVNTGNATVSGITVTDPLFTPSDITANCTFPTTDGTLAPTEAVTCEATYTLTQADIDAGGVTNTATADGTDPSGNPVSDDSDSTNPADDTGADDDPTVVSTELAPALNLVKLASPQFEGPPSVSDLITYTFTVTNTGNVTVSDITVTDPLFTPADITVGCEFPTIDGTLAPTEIATCEADYTITVTDIDAGGVENTATADGAGPTGEAVSDVSDSGDELTESASLTGETDGDSTNDPTVVEFEKPVLALTDETSDPEAETDETIQDSNSATGTLAFTGVTSGLILAIGATLLTSGYLMVARSRRRSVV